MRIQLSEELHDASLLARAFGTVAKVYGSPAGSYIGGIATDSREVLPGDLFVALPGKRVNGDTYVGEALKKGAVGILTASQKPIPFSHFFLFWVPDAEAALLKAAAFWRKQQKGRVIAVTGSTGKTTVKDALSCVLHAPCSAGNFNSNIGMPLSVLSLPKASFWVLELGVSHQGEMQKMALALQPDIGVLTNIGSAHIGEFGSREIIFREKSELCKHLSPGGYFVIPSSFQKSDFPIPPQRILRAGEGTEADGRVVNLSFTQSESRCDFQMWDRVITNLAWRVPGRIGVSVLATVATVGVLCGCSAEEIRDGLVEAAKRMPRMKEYSVGDTVFLDDSYNASPESMMAALEVLYYKGMGRTRVAVLGDILELGDYSKELHREVGKRFLKIPPDLLFTYGTYAGEIARIAQKDNEKLKTFSYLVGEEEQLVQDVVTHVPRGAVLLFKGSHGMRMDRIIKKVGEYFEK